MPRGTLGEGAWSEQRGEQETAALLLPWKGFSWSLFQDVRVLGTFPLSTAGERERVRLGEQSLGPVEGRSPGAPSQGEFSGSLASSLWPSSDTLDLAGGGGTPKVLGDSPSQLSLNKMQSPGA